LGEGSGGHVGLSQVVAVVRHVFAATAARHAAEGLAERRRIVCLSHEGIIDVVIGGFNQSATDGKQERGEPKHNEVERVAFRHVRQCVLSHAVVRAKSGERQV